MFDLDVYAKILDLNIGISQPDNEEMFRLLGGIHPLRTRRYASGEEHNGWVVPHGWKVHKAFIRKDGKVLFDGTVHPLAVAGYSPSFCGTLDKAELDTHIFTRESMAEVYPFHCMNNYRPWAREWGFCVPYNHYKEWDDGDYEVELETEYLKGAMLVGECLHKGELDDTIVFNAHTCHPAQFNDGFAGVAVILELFRWLSSIKTRYSYLGVFAPEHLGTVFYLANLSKEERRRLRLGIFVEMVGIDYPLALQKSFTGDTVIDRVAEYVMRRNDPALKIGAFRTIVGNDETVWEAPGIEVPFISISRCHRPDYYDQYHTNADNLSINSEDKLRQAFDCLKNIVSIFEDDQVIDRQFEGLVALSNPRYNLYIERPDPTVNKALGDFELNMGPLQDYLPRYFNGKHSVFEIAQRFNVSFVDLLVYLKKFEKKGLITFKPVTNLSSYLNK